MVDKTLRLQGFPTYDNLRLLLPEDKTSKNSLQEPSSTDSWFFHWTNIFLYQAQATYYSAMKTNLKNFDICEKISILKKFKMMILKKWMSPQKKLLSVKPTSLFTIKSTPNL